MNATPSNLDAYSPLRLRQLATLSWLFADQTLDLETLLETIVTQISTVLPDGCSIRLVAEDGRLMPPAALAHPDPVCLAFMRDTLVTAPQRLSEGVSGWVAASSEAFFIPRLGPEHYPFIQPEYRAYVERFGAHSTIIVPLRRRGVLLGTIAVVRDTTPGPYQDHDVPFLQDLADCATIAIEHARLHARVRAATDTLDRWVTQRAHDLNATHTQLEAELSARRQLETRLDHVYRRHQMILDSLGEGVIVVDLQGYCIFANPAALAMLGWTREAFLGQPMHTALHHSTPDGTLVPRDTCLICQALAEGTPYQRDHDSLWTRDGTRIPTLVNLTPLFDGDERIGAVIAFSDISRQQQAEHALRAATAAAEQANHAKSDFLSRMSHELRTPLNAILGFTQVLQMDVTNADQQASLGHIYHGGRHLLSLINEVLDLARIEAGYLALSPEPVLVHTVLLEVIATIRPLAAPRSIAISADLEAISTRLIYADCQRFKQVMLNLLSNAIKYNRDHGQIRITGLLCGERMRLAIADTGIGIPAGQLGALFVPFERLGQEHTATEGTGLGLALSKRLVEAMAGTISASSVAGQGSTFTMEFPLAADPAVSGATSAMHVDTRLQGQPLVEHQVVVLLIEDNLANLRLIERLLGPTTGIRLLAATHGQHGIALAREHRPALILLDLHLPDMHGEGVLHRLLAEPETRAIPVVVMTADATARQADRLLASGARAYLTKPIDVPTFLHTVTDLIPR